MYFQDTVNRFLYIYEFFTEIVTFRININMGKVNLTFPMWW